MMFNTVNVIEYEDGTILRIRSFDDGATGCNQAEELFAQLIREHVYAVDEDTIEHAKDDGRWVCGSYEVYLCHSTDSSGN